MYIPPHERLKKTPPLSICKYVVAETVVWWLNVYVRSFVYIQHALWKHAVFWLRKTDEWKTTIQIKNKHSVVNECTAEFGFSLGSFVSRVELICRTDKRERSKSILFGVSRRLIARSIAAQILHYYQHWITHCHRKKKLLLIDKQTEIKATYLLFKLYRRTIFCLNFWWVLAMSFIVSLQSSVYTSFHGILYNWPMYYTHIVLLVNQKLIHPWFRSQSNTKILVFGIIAKHRHTEKPFIATL